MHRNRPRMRYPRVPGRRPVRLLRRPRGRLQARHRHPLEARRLALDGRRRRRHRRLALLQGQRPLPRLLGACRHVLFDMHERLCKRTASSASSRSRATAIGSPRRTRHTSASSISPGGRRHDRIHCPGPAADPLCRRPPAALRRRARCRSGLARAPASARWHRAADNPRSATTRALHANRGPAAGPAAGPPRRPPAANGRAVRPPRFGPRSCAPRASRLRVRSHTQSGTPACPSRSHFGGIQADQPTRGQSCRPGSYPFVISQMWESTQICTDPSARFHG